MHTLYTCTSMLDIKYMPISPILHNHAMHAAYMQTYSSNMTMDWMYRPYHTLLPRVNFKDQFLGV